MSKLSTECGILTTAFTGTLSTSAGKLSTEYATAGAAPAIPWSNNNYIVLADGGSIKVPIANTDLNSSHSIMFRYKSDSFTATGLTNQMFGLVSTAFAQPYAGYTRQSGLSIQLRGTASYTGIIGSSGINYASLPSSVNGIDDGNWHTIIMIWNSPGGQNATTTVTASNLISYFEIYIDSYLSSSKLSLTGASNSGGNWQWGSVINELRLNDFINGVNEVGCAIDEVAYWQGHALSESERNLAYNNGTSVDLANTTNLTIPTTYHQFEDSSNQNYDNISSSNIGTVTSGTTTAY